MLTKDKCLIVPCKAGSIWFWSGSGSWMDGIERREDETINYGTEGRDQIDGNGYIFRKWF